MMLLTLTTKRQMTFLVQILQTLGASVGDKIELLPSPAGYLLRTRIVNYSRLLSLRKKIAASAQDFDIHQFRETKYERSLRD